MTPARIQLSRARGHRLPYGAINCARPGRWGNPHKVTADCPPAEAVRRFRDDLEAGRLPYTVADVRRDLGGRPLACWCRPGEPCHAETLRDVANAGFPEPLTMITGDCRAELRKLPDHCVDCVVTSPPYWNLRDYGHAGQLGREPTIAEYLAAMVAVFEEVRRVLRPTGTLWVNMGDSYVSQAGGRQGKNGARADRRHTQNMPRKGVKACGGLQLKQLVGMPWRLAFALQEAGWWLRGDYVWHKPNPMPESAQDRCTKAHEYIFHLAPAPDYYHDRGAIDEPVTGGSRPRGAVTPKGTDLFPDLEPAAAAGPLPKTPSGWATGEQNRRTHVGRFSEGRGVNPKAMTGGESVKQNASFSAAVCDLVERRNKRSVWTVPTFAFPGAHFATFPPDLVRPCIRAGCAPGAVVLDPFGGSGTTGLVALEEGRRAVLIEASPEFMAMARERCAAAAEQPVFTI